MNPNDSHRATRVAQQPIEPSPRESRHLSRLHMRLRTAILLIFLCLGLAPGCRAIRRTVDSRQSIEARRMSREGLAAIHQNRWEEAEKLFEAALELSRSDDRAYWGYSEVLWQKGQHAEAISHLEQAVRLSAGAPELRVRLGNMYLEEDRVDDAATQVAHVLESTRDMATAWALHGDILVRQEKLEAALASYHRAISLDRQSPQVRLAIADIYSRQQRHDRLLATVDQLEESTIPTEQAAQLEMMRGIAMRELGHPDSGAQHLQRAIALGMSGREVYHELAKTELASRRFAAASHAIRNALQLAPDDAESLSLAQNIQQAQARLAADTANDDLTQER